LWHYLQLSSLLASITSKIPKMKITKASSVFIQVVETDDSDLLYFRGQGGGWYRLQHDMSWKYLDNPDKYEEAYQEYVLASIPK